MNAQKPITAACPLGSKAGVATPPRSASATFTLTQWLKLGRELETDGFRAMRVPRRSGLLRTRPASRFSPFGSLPLSQGASHER